MTKEWTGNKMSTFSVIGSSAHSKEERASGDFYETDPSAITALYFADKLPKNKSVWECACGRGALSKELERYGCDVISTDLYDRGFGKTGIDFLQTKELLAPCILTNPPYVIATEFVSHALKLGADEIYMFVKLQFLEGIRRFKEIYNINPPCEILQFIERQRVIKNGNYERYKEASAMAFCWLVWRKDYIGKPTFDWITAKGGERYECRNI